MNVLVVAKGIPTKDNPGLGIFEFDQAQALSEAGVNVTYLAVDLRSIRRKRKFGTYTIVKNGIKIYVLSIPLGNISHKLFYGIAGNALKKALPNILEEEKIDIVHTHFFEIGAVMSYAKLPSNVKWIHTEHSSTVNTSNVNDTIKKYSYFYKMVDKLIVVSTALGKSIRDNFGVESICIHNILDIKNFEYSERQYTEKFTFVSTGNLVEIKRMDYLIQAFSTAFKNNHNVELLIIGDGPLREELNEQIKKEGMSGRICLLGRKSREEINDIYKNCGCFVLLSQSETFGVAYIEALATGLPVIATKCGGPEDFVNEDNGRLVEHNDICEIVEKLEFVLNNKEYFDNKKISKNIIERFMPEVISKEIIKVYKSLSVI